MPAKPSPAAGGGWKFEFPLAAAGTCPAADTTGPSYNVSACSHVDYLSAPYSTPLSGTMSVTFTVTASADAVFGYHTQFKNTCTAPAAVRLWFEQTGDNLTQPTYRWWATQGLALGPGTFTLSVPLTLGNWTDVNGKADAAGMAAAMASPMAVGMTFGGGCFAGHGVHLTAGSAMFTVTDFHISP
jgi:hypothetical protein